MTTSIFVTKKLEAVIKCNVLPNNINNTSFLGKWNATVFYLDRRKCLLFSNGTTKYNVIVADFKVKDLKKIGFLFTDAFHQQLNFDGISIFLNCIQSIIGELEFHPTDNDRSTISFQNQRIGDVNVYKSEYAEFEMMPIQIFCNRMNINPISIGTSKTKYTNSIAEMKKLLTSGNFII